MSVDDGGLEVLKKAAEQDPNGSAGAEYLLKTKNVFSAGWVNEAIGRKIEATYPDPVTEVYTFKQGATVLYVLTIVYTDATKAVFLSAERTA